MNREDALRVYPPAIIEAAGTARAGSQAALEAGGALSALGATAGASAAFRPGAGSAFARLHSAWLTELSRLASDLSGLGYRAEAAAEDYLRTDRRALGPALPGRAG